MRRATAHWYASSLWRYCIKTSNTSNAACEVAEKPLTASRIAENHSWVFKLGGKCNCPDWTRLALKQEGQPVLHWNEIPHRYWCRVWIDPCPKRWYLDWSACRWCEWPEVSCSLRNKASQRRRAGLKKTALKHKAQIKKSLFLQTNSYPSTAGLGRISGYRCWLHQSVPEVLNRSGNQYWCTWDACQYTPDRCGNFNLKGIYW